MGLKEYWSKISGWLIGQEEETEQEPRPRVNEEGLMTGGFEQQREQEAGTQAAGIAQAETKAEQEAGEEASFTGREEQAGIERTKDALYKRDINRLQDRFDRLIEKMGTISETLNLQLAQGKMLLERMDKMPEIVRNFPAIADSQMRMGKELSEHLAAMIAKNERFLEAVEKIPAEAIRQTDMLAEINEHLASSTDVDMRMADSFRRFNEILTKLSQNTVSQAESIMEMSRAFSSSDRYLKYVISRQNRQFIWLFGVSVGVCFVTILILVGIVMYLK